MTFDKTTGTPQHLTLDGRLGLAEAAHLHRQFLALDRSRDLRVDAQSVTHLGSLCLQVLIAAARDWRRTGQDFQLGPRSAAVALALANFAVHATIFAPNGAE